MKKIILPVLSLCLILFSTQYTQAKEPIQVTHNEKGIYILKINTKKLGEKIKPAAVENLTSAKDVYDCCDYLMVVNGGFFDMKTGGEISYVVIDGVEVQSPCNNQKLLSDLERDNRTKEVLNRTEFRVLEKKNGKLDFQIAAHNDPLKKGSERIRHSLQGGPRIAPEMDLIGESFVKYDEKGKLIFDSASVTKRRERTVLALKGNNLYVIIFTENNKKSMNELYDFCKKKKLREAMALDGGGSTSLYYSEMSAQSKNKIFASKRMNQSAQNTRYKNIGIYSECPQGSQGRKVKSFLVIEK